MDYLPSGDDVEFLCERPREKYAGHGRWIFPIHVSREAAGDSACVDIECGVETECAPWRAANTIKRHIKENESASAVARPVDNDVRAGACDSFPSGIVRRNQPATITPYNIVSLCFGSPETDGPDHE